MTGKPKLPWTDEEDEFLTSMVHSAEYAFMDMSIRLERPLPSVKARMDKLGLVYKYDYKTAQIGKSVWADRMPKKPSAQLRHQDGERVMYE